jgi:hypothetical protein
LAQAKLSGEFDGADGNDGISPTITVSAITGGHRIKITDTSGTKSIDVMNGDPGNPGEDGVDGKDGTSATHSWNGTTLTISSASGTSSANLKGDKGERGEKGYTP